MRASIGLMLMTLASLTAAQDATVVTADKEGEHITRVSVWLRAPREAVFRALTSCEAITQWMKSDRMTLSQCEADARVGGTLKLAFLAPQGRRVQVVDTYRELVTPQLIRYDESYDFSPLQIAVTVTLGETSGGTLFEERLKYRSKQERDTDFPGIEESVQRAYAELSRYLQGATSSPAASTR